MRFTRAALLVLLVTLPAACSGTGDTGPNPPPHDGLWTWSASSSEILRFDGARLNGVGGIDPATALTTTSISPFSLSSIAFDTDGTLWLASQHDSMLLGFAPDALASSGAATARVAIGSTGGSLNGPSSIAFDRQHRLWVADRDGGTLVRFDRAQLTASGTPAPAVVISGIPHPNAIAFDAAGSLWVSEAVDQKVVKFSEAQLAASGSPAPAVVLGSTTAGMIVNPAGIAFDTAGNLWVADYGNQTLAKFSPAQQAASGNPAPDVAISGDAHALSLPVGLAFDAGGNLWVMEGIGVLEKFSPALLATSGQKTPTASLTLTGHTLFWSVAFWPRPAGLPLN